MRAWLGRLALEPLFGAGSRDDVVAVAETQACLEGALLGPESVELGGDLLQLGSKSRVVSLAQLVIDLGAAIARDVDLPMDVFERSHGSKNVGRGLCIPGLLTEEKQDQNGSTNHRGDDRDHLQERRHA
jgi:hypothetical protein